MDDIKQMRRELGMTAVRFAQLIGCSHITVYNWERGRCRPSPLALERLTKIGKKLKSQKNKWTGAVRTEKIAP